MEADAFHALTGGGDLEWCVVAVTGSHAQGTHGSGSGLDLGAIWIASTADLLRLTPPPSTLIREGHHLGTDTTLLAAELAEALRRLLEGDSWVLDTVFSHRNVSSSDVHEHLVERARDGLHRGHVEHYLSRAASLRARGTAQGRRTAAATLLQASHLLRTGIVSTDPQELARHADHDGLLDRVPGDDQLDALLSSIRGSMAASPLPPAHPRPEALDEFLLYVREAYWR